MANPEFDLEPYDFSETAQRESVLMEAMAVTEDERWKHLGADNPELTMQLIRLRAKLMDEGEPTINISLALASYVHMYYSIEATKNLSAPQEPTPKEAEVLAFDGDKKRKRVKPWSLLRYGAAIIPLGLRSSKSDSKDSY